MKFWFRLLLFLVLYSVSTVVIAQPVILVQPQFQTVPRGGSTTFWVEATGADPVTYQWYLNSFSNPIAGATNSTYTITNVQDNNVGSYRVTVFDPNGSVFSTTARLDIFSSGRPQFGTITLEADFELNGVGNNVDSIAFFEAPEPTNTLMIVTAKGNDRLEVYQYPFENNELPHIQFPANVNGVVVDQETDLLYVSDDIVTVLTLPDLQVIDTFGDGIIGTGENNLDILKNTNGQTQIYVSEDHEVHRFVATNWTYLGTMSPPAPVVSIETVLADDFYQIILVPEEQGGAGNAGVYVYLPDGTPFNKNGTNVFGINGEFDADEEGILLYTFPSNGVGDDGTGFYVVADQRMDPFLTDYEFFDRITWEHFGTLRIQGVSNTDGIASTQMAMPGYPMGLFAAINDDRTTVGLGWDDIFAAIDASSIPRVTGITPIGPNPTNADSVQFEVVFNKAVTNFNDASDLIITQNGITHTNVSIIGGGTSYQVQVEGITGTGFMLLAVSTTNDVTDLQTNALASSVTSVPVVIGSPYGVWADFYGLVAGVNDGFLDDPDGDGCSNIKEFAIDSNPLSSADDGKKRMAIDDLGGTNVFTYTFPVRSGTVFVSSTNLVGSADGVTYALDGSYDLISFGNHALELSPPIDGGLPTPSPGWDYRTFRLDQAITDQDMGYIRLLISP